MKIVFPLILGVVSVLQAGLNEKMIPKWGISFTVIINTVVLLVVGLVAWKLAPVFPDRVTNSLQVANQTGGWQWWYLIPGILGYFLVAGIPLNFQMSGAALTMTLLVASQILAGFGWDLIVDKSSASTPQVIGAGLAIAAAAVSAIGKT